MTHQTEISKPETKRSPAERSRLAYRLCGLLPLLGALTAGAVLAQGAPREPLPALSESVDVRLVNLEAVVTDKGAPVHGLAAGDFRLRVNGKDQPIEFFSEVRGGVALAAEAAAPAGGARPVPTVSPGTPVGTSYLVFIDDYFSLAQDRDRVLEALRGQLAALRPEDRMAIVAYDGDRLEMLSSWTSSVTALEEAIRQAEQWPALGLQRWSERRSYEVASLLPASLRWRRSRVLPSSFATDLTPDQYFYARLLEDQVDRVVTAAAATLRGFGAAPGRRVAILLSGGWPDDVPAYVTSELSRPVIDTGFAAPGELYRPLIDTANQLGYTLYPVDLPGMQASAFGPGEAGRGDFSSPRTIAYEQETQNHDALRRLARDTGGEALLDAARTEVLSTPAADTGSYYWIGFTPSRKLDDSRWKVVLETTRPGLELRARRSFTDSSRDSEIGMALESALLFGNPPSAQPLVATLSKGRDEGARKVRASLSIEVPSQAITLVEQGGRYVADLELRVAALDSDGASSEGAAIPVTLAVEKPGAAKSLVYQVDLELRRKTEKLVVALYDRASGAILMTPLDVVL